VLSPEKDSMLAQRLKRVDNLSERLFAAYFLAGDSAIERTLVGGNTVYQRGTP